MKNDTLSELKQIIMDFSESELMELRKFAENLKLNNSKAEHFNLVKAGDLNENT